MCDKCTTPSGFSIADICSNDLWWKSTNRTTICINKACLASKRISRLNDTDYIARPFT